VDLVDYLFQEKILTYEQHEQVAELSKRWGVAAHPLLRTLRLVDDDLYLRAYERVFGRRRIDLETVEWNQELFDRLEWPVWRKGLALPVKDANGKDLIVAPDPVNLSRDIQNLKVETGVILEEEWVVSTKRFLGQKFLDEAVNGLARNFPESSAKQTFTPVQVILLWAMITLTVIGLIVAAGPTIVIVNTLINVFYFVCVGFKSLLVLAGANRNMAHKVDREEIAALRDDELPVYTVHVPVYKEPKVIPHLVNQLANLDYPVVKLDVKVLLEEDDDATINAFKASNPPPNFHAVIVPAAQPKTKPKACNYGLWVSLGDYLTIYDAEDLPESDQVKKVLAAFNKLPDHVVVMQGALNYFNWPENLLTRLFTLEYSNWFDYTLPGMEALNVPIPLGGTSNHFKTDRLIELGAWDPFNVTEDADLGVRATARGYTVSTIDSTTYEEANRAYGNWIRQRSRWIKGYMQTFLVNMRNPFKLIKRIGLKAFFGFVMFIGGTPFIFLMNPILWAIFIIWLVTRAEVFSDWFPTWLLFLSFFNLLIGNFMAVYVCILAVFKRKSYPLSIYALLNPLYWMMHAYASYKGLYQLLVKPFYWEKTEHGLSTMAPVSSAGRVPGASR